MCAVMRHFAFVMYSVVVTGNKTLILKFIITDDHSVVQSQHCKYQYYQLEII